MKIGVSLALAACLAAVSISAHAEDPLPRAKPEAVGLSSERLARIGTVLTQDIAGGRIPGAVVAVARHGKLVYFEAFGYRDKEAGVKMTTDTIFNIASMTKPMVAVGALMLYEQGALLMDQPLSHYFPQFAKMQVAVLDETGNAITSTVAARRQITIQDLLRHTSGLIYGGRGTTAVHRLYPEGSNVAAEALTGPEFLDKLASLPLLWQPGSTWDYGFGLDITGLLIEKISGQPLADYLQARLWKPLGMTDTGFRIPPAKAQRYAKALPVDPDTGRPQRVGPVATQPNPTKFDCGGGCAVSTASDYVRFASMLLDKGALGKTRILGRKTVEYMLSNQLGPEVKNLIANADPTRADYGFGLGLAVRQTVGVVRMMGSAGEFNWPGASGTNWWADPKEDLVVVFMAHSPGPIRWHYRQKINALVYAALAD